MSRARTDGAAFARAAVRLLTPAVALDEAALAGHLDEAFADIESDVPARRLARVRSVVVVVGRDDPDEVDLIAATVAEQTAGRDGARDAFGEIREALEPLARLG